MNWADFAILAIMAVSAIISISRGFMREALSLMGWVLAFWLALTFSESLAAWLTPWVSVPSVRLISGFLFLLIATLLLTALLNYLMGQLVDKTGLTGTDRMLGVLFGIVRGGLIVTILVLLAGLTPLPNDPWWQESQLIPYFQELAVWLRGFLPEDVAEMFNYS